MSLIYRPKIFSQFDAVRAGQTLQSPADDVFGFNMSLSVGDNQELVWENRRRITRMLGFDDDTLATQRQVHGDVVCTVGEGYCVGESDALISDCAGWLLAISVADCIPVLVYDSKGHVVAGVHSGWRGTQQRIAEKTLSAMFTGYGCKPEDMYVYIGVSAGQCCYEVGEDVASVFPERYSKSLNTGKFLFDNKGAVLDQILQCGIPSRQIELDPRCTICDTNFHSYRRNGASSGRMFAVIGMLS